MENTAPSEESTLIQDVGHWFVDTFKEDLYRSRNLKTELYKLAPIALQEASEILNSYTTKENIAAKVKLIQMILEAGIIKTEMPRVQKEYTTANGETTKVSGPSWEPYRITKEEVLEFLDEALEKPGEEHLYQIAPKKEEEHE